MRVGLVSEGPYAAQLKRPPPHALRKNASAPHLAPPIPRIPGASRGGQEASWHCDGAGIRRTGGHAPLGQGEKSFRFNGGGRGGFVRMSVEIAHKPTAFQAEYEGSIPFTRSSCDSNGLARNFKLPL